MTWTDDAACLNYPAKIFYPDIIDDDGEEWFDEGTIFEAFGDTSSSYDEARTICNTCPVKEACLAHALANKERWGMWGGLTPIERRRIERKDRRRRRLERERQAVEATK